jgi:hypothetical protein
MPVSSVDLTKMVNYENEAKKWNWILASDSIVDGTKESDPIEPEAKAWDPTKLQAYSWVWVGTDVDPFSATRINWWWSFFKDNILQTNMFWFVDIDGNPLKTEWFGKLFLTKKVYKWLNIEAEYTFTWSGNNVMKFWLSFAWKTKNWWYKITVLPLNSTWQSIWESFDVKVWWNRKIWDKWSLSAFVDVTWLKSFYWETEFAYNFWENIAAFAQVRYGGLIEDPFLRGVGWVRLNIK